MTSLRIETLSGIHEIDAGTWDTLVDASGGSFLLRHGFLLAFERSASVCAATGWEPRHLVIRAQRDASDVERADDQPLIAAIPLYAKGHSYGEFVFDWAWADAYRRNGLSYYPKWLSAVPFTPVPGARLLALPEFRRLAARGLVEYARTSQLSSLHVLYTNADDQNALLDAGCLPRRHVQFHWINRGWPDFDAFLASLVQSKRKKIRAERRKVREAGVTTRVLTGAQIGQAEWDFFYRCYANTYHQRGNPPYLTPAFFEAVGAQYSQHCVMAIADHAGHPVAASLLWLDHLGGASRLYGRYWGALERIDCLHFELAYYTPLAWAIEHGIDVVEGGAQGEHKLARGFEPVQTQSAHWLAHPAFADAIANFLDRERDHIDAYANQLNSPYRPEIGD